MLDKIIKSEMFNNYLQQEAVTCPKCGDGIIRDRREKVCVECFRLEKLQEEYRGSIKVINEGTNYEGLDWDNIISGQNGMAAKEIKRITEKDPDFNILIYGANKGVGKSTTGWIIKHHQRISGNSVKMVAQAEAQKMMAAHKDDPYHVLESYKYCDVLILDEIGRGVSDSSYYGDKKYFRQCWYEVIDYRIDHKKPTILIGNVSGLHRGDNMLTQGAYFADDFFDKDRLKYYTAFEFKGNSYRGR